MPTMLFRPKWAAYEGEWFALNIVLCNASLMPPAARMPSQIRERNPVRRTPPSSLGRLLAAAL